jgi:hypothetical protein
MKIRRPKGQEVGLCVCVAADLLGIIISVTKEPFWQLRCPTIRLTLGLHHSHSCLSRKHAVSGQRSSMLHFQSIR